MFKLEMITNAFVHMDTKEPIVIVSRNKECPLLPFSAGDSCCFKRAVGYTGLAHFISFFV